MEAYTTRPLWNAELQEHNYVRKIVASIMLIDEEDYDERTGTRIGVIVGSIVQAGRLMNDGANFL